MSNKVQVAFIEAGKAQLQFGDSVPNGAQEIENWRFISPLEVAEVAARLAGDASLLTLDASVKKDASAKKAKGI